MMDLLCLYLVNVMRPVFEDPKSSGTGGGEDAIGDDDASFEESVADEDEEEVVSSASTSGEPVAGGTKIVPKRLRRVASGTRKGSGGRQLRFKDIELLDLNGPKLILGMRSWFLLYQIIGQINWIGKPLYVSIIYKALLIPACVYVLWRDFLEPITQTINISDQFKNPIFVFISLSAAATMFLHAILTIYNNLFNLCPLFKVLTTERLCFVREEVQHIVGSKTMPTMLFFFAVNCLLFRMCVARDLEDFVHQFDIIQFMVDYFVVLWLGYHFIGVSYIDFYIRVCFGIWIIAMKTNLEYRFAYLQKHQRVRGAPQRRPGGGASLLAGALAHERSQRPQSSGGDSRRSFIATEADGDTAASELRQRATNAGLVPDTATATTKSEKADRLMSCSSSFSMADHMTLADFKAKYKIDTLDEIQRNLNTMDDHLEVSREFQNSSLVLITLSAFLTNGALLLLAYNLLANQKNYFHGVLIALLAASYTICIFLCYIGDSWILYALESFVQTVEDEYFLQSGGGGDGAGASHQADGDDQRSTTLPRLLGDETISSYEPMGQQHQYQPDEWAAHPLSAGTGTTVRPSTATDYPQSDVGSEPAPTGQHAIAQSYHLFMIKKRDVLFCREFLHQFQNHLATPWSKLTFKIQLHMLGTFVTLIAAQIIFDREH